MKKSARLTLLTLLVSGLSLLMAPQAPGWRFDSYGGRAEPMVVDAAGDVIVGGRVFYGGEVFKLSGTTGQVIWRFNVSQNLSEHHVSALAVDSNGDVFVAFATNKGVRKLSGATGVTIWNKPIGGSIGGCQTYINSMAVDPNGNVVTAGTSGCLFNVAKLDGLTGDEKWHYEREGYGMSVAADRFGDVAASGIMNNNFGVVKLHGASGIEVWQRELNGNGNFTDVFEEANSVAMDSDGSVIAAGITSNRVANFRDFTVAKYTPGGALEWAQVLDGGWCEINDHGEQVCQSNDEAHAVAVAKDGSVFATGFMQADGTPLIRGANEHFHVVKISRGGELIWSKPAEEAPFNGEYTRGRGMTLAVNTFGNVVAGGVHNGRFTLVKFWGRTGGRAWRRQLTSGMDVTLNGNNAVRVAMDAASDVVAAGETLGDDGFDRFTVAKLRRVDGLDYSIESPPAVPETVLKYAPVVYLHSDDEYRPGDPMMFIRGSELKWSHQAQNLLVPCDDHSDAERGTIDATRLGAAATSPYSHWPKVHSETSCDHRTDIPPLAAYERTRPFDGAERQNVLGQEKDYMKEGYYLDPDDDDNELRNGVETGPSVFPGAPVFYEYVEHQYVTYWFFYPYDKFEVGLPYPTSIPDQEHEGDWERISFQLDSNDVLQKAFYYGHKDGMPLSLGSIEFEGTHPVVYSAKGSHASYPHVGDDYATEVPLLHDHTDRGPKWFTWNNILKVESQPWYGFGGAWGEVGELPVITIPIFSDIFGNLSGSDWTGPLGPSLYKTSSDEWADAIPPQLNLPANILVNADVPQGARVYFAVTATDNVTQSPRIACTPASGSVFPVGATTVSCTAFDNAGNSANGVFSIIVKGAGEQIIDLTILVKNFNSPTGLENSLLAKLQNAFTKLTRGDTAGACNQLSAFINEVQAQSGKKISVTQANQMLAAASRIRKVLGC